MLSVGWPQAMRLASRAGTRSAFLAQSCSKNVSTRSYNSYSTNASRRSISTRELAVPSRSANLLRLLPKLHFMTNRTFHSSRTTRDDNTDDEAQAAPQTISLSKISMNLHADPRAVCYVAEVFTFATLYDTGKGEPIAEWLGFAMNENPHRITDWLLSLWHYLLTDSAKYHRKDAQPASDTRIDEIFTYVLYACRMAWAHQDAKDFVHSFVETSGIKDSLPKSHKLASAILANDAAVNDEQPIIGSFKPIDAVAGELSSEEHMDLVIAQLTIGASTWLDCQWGRIFASANEDSLRKLIDVATLAPAENSWDDFIKSKSRYENDTVGGLKAATGINALWSLCAVSKDYPIIKHLIQNIYEEVKTAKDTYWTTENGCISSRAARLLILERIVNDTFAMPTSESKSFSSQYLFISDGPHALSRSSVIDREVEALSNRLNELVEAANIPLKPAYSVEIKTDDDIDVLQKIQRRWEGIAVNFPPQFENDDEKAECVADLQRAMHVIATTSTKFSLFRLHGGAAYLAARIFEMGYNLDIPLSYDPQNKTPVAYYFYKAALDHTPSDPELVCDFGVCLAQTRSPKAIQVLQRARDLGSVSANWPLGLQYHFAGRTDDAITALKKFAALGDEEKARAEAFIGAITRGGVKVVRSEFGEPLPLPEKD